ncbi:MAG: endonuclease Q family protein [Candidatus Hermodarchaeota archaeon]
MEVVIDVHAHSVFAGGTQALTIKPETMIMNRKKAILHLEKTNQTMPLKGIDVIGTGDCQFALWIDILKEVLIEERDGVFFLQDKNQTCFILQTEMIFTTRIGNYSKETHVIFLFPNFSSVDEFRTLLDQWGVKHQKMARPFIICQTKSQVAERIHSILDLDPWVEAIPSHIMTPQGVFGSGKGNIRINHLTDFFDSATSRLRVFETGLSADPEFLALIPELDDKVLISNSDAHSSALHRMGREYTVLSTSNITYKSILSALRNNHILYTAEFPPEEGRFFLTGHRAGRKRPGLHGENDYCFFSPQHVPSHDVCPICNKSLTIGVFQRCVEISEAQGVKRDLGGIPKLKKFIRMVPLIDILSYVLDIKTKTAKSLITKYRQIINIIGPERILWQLASEDIETKLNGQIEEPILQAILKVKAGDFTFKPYGFDGIYGSLVIGQKGNYKNVNVIHSSKPIQQTL